jgi:hypothetical protein
MKSLDKFGAVLAVTLLMSIAYLSMSTVIEEVVIYQPYENIIHETDTLTVTKVDTVWKFHTWKDDVIENEDNLIVSMSFLFHIADDNNIANEIRDALPFGEVFNFWRDKIGPCGIFEWNENLYITLYREEKLTDCEFFDKE